MAGWRDIKSLARAIVHQTFEVPAVYLTHVAGIPVPVTVRDHSKVMPRETDTQAPQMQELVPKVIFNAAQVANPLRHAYVVFGPQEIVQLGAADPARGGYMAVECVLLNPAECATLVASLGDVTLIPAWEGVLWN